MKVQLLVSMVLTASLFSCGDGGTPCTLMACSDAVKVVFEHPLADDGDYEVIIAMPDETITCNATLPPELERYRCQSTNPDRPVNSVGLNIDRAGAGPLRGFWIEAAPESLAVTVEKDGAEIASRTLEPAYTKFQPNGAACDGDYFCRIGEATLPLD